MGNSEVGHLNIGAGRVVYQDLTRINLAIEDGSFFENRVLRQACAKAAGRGSRLHLMGLVSGGGVHADMDHLEACLELASREKVRDVVVHAFLDGRDTPPQSAKGYLATIQAAMDRLGVGRYGVISGRYYAMDRDTRWDRVKLAYDALVYGEGFFAADAQAAVDAAYARGENDEFVRPTIVAPEHDSRVRDGDVCLFFNFRPDRARELTRAFTERGFAEFDRGAAPAVRRLRHHDAVQEGVPAAGRVPAGPPGARARRRPRRARPAAAAHRRDREVRARHLLLQRRRGEGGRGGGARARAQPARRADLRPQARDERRRRHRRARRPDRGGRASTSSS